MAPADEATTGEQRAGDSPRPAVPDTAQVAAGGGGSRPRRQRAAVRCWTPARLHPLPPCAVALTGRSRAGTTARACRVVVHCLAACLLCGAVPSWQLLACLTCALLAHRFGPETEMLLGFLLGHD